MRPATSDSLRRHHQANSHLLGIRLNDSLGPSEGLPAELECEGFELAEACSTFSFFSQVAWHPHGR
eukprot:10461667-Alexandrium_andersonii.AAC.1